MGIDAFEFPFLGGVVDKHKGGIRVLTLYFFEVFDIHRGFGYAIDEYEVVFGEVLGDPFGDIWVVMIRSVRSMALYRVCRYASIEGRNPTSSKALGGRPPWPPIQGSGRWHCLWLRCFGRVG